MPAQTPIERAVATYRVDWERGTVDRPGIAKVNPETLGNATSPEFTFRYIDISSVSQGIIDWSGVPQLRFAEAPSRARRIVRHGDAMICTVRPLLASHVFADWPGDYPTVCSTGFAVVRREGRLLPNFLKHLLFAEQVTRQLLAWQCGTNYPAVNERDIRQLVLPIAPKDEQAHIARILDAVDTALERTRATLIAAKALATSLGEDAVAGVLLNPAIHSHEDKTWIHPRLGSIPKTWSVERLRKACSRIVDGTHQAVQTSRAGVPFLYVSCVREGRILWENAGKITERTYSFISKGREPQAGCVLYTAVGSYGNAALVTTREPFSFQRHIAILYPRPQRLLGGYLAMWLNSSKGKRWSQIHAVGNAQKTVTLTELGKLLIPLPPIEVQHKLCEVVSGAEAKVDTVARRLSAFGDLKRALIHDLLTGRVRVKSPVAAIAS